MTPYARSGLLMIASTAILCGAVIVATAPLRCRMEENERKHNLKGLQP